MVNPFNFQVYVVRSEFSVNTMYPRNTTKRLGIIVHKNTQLVSLNKSRAARFI